MTILLDACVPRPLRNFLRGHSVRTAQEMGWGQLKNGLLLHEAEAAGFDLLISTDQNLGYQQNLGGRKLAILVLPTNDWPAIRAQGETIAGRIPELKQGQFLEMKWK